MSVKLYYEDPYLSRFEAEVVSVDGKRIYLDRTAFYPGGGGQQGDTGRIGEKPVVEVGVDGGDIFHVVEGSLFEQGQQLSCEIDWPRRYDLMKGHTGQHILFRSLQEQSPDLAVVKIDITPDRKSLFVNGELSWDAIRKAVAKANQVIFEDNQVAIRDIPLDSEELEEVRVKIDRLKGDAARIVSIGDFDAAACSGVHVAKTSEIGGISVTRMISGRQTSDWELQFAVGPEAIMSASILSVTALSAADLLGTSIENVEPTITNLRASSQQLSEQLRSMVAEQVDNLEPEMIGSFSLYYKIIHGADRKKLTEAASKIIRRDGATVVLCDISEGGYLLVGCNEKLSIDCRELLKIGMGILGGRGGGKRNFAMGGSPDGSRCEEAFGAVLEAMRELLTTQHACE